MRQNPHICSNRGNILRQVYINSSFKTKLNKRNFSVQHRNTKNNTQFRKFKYTNDSSINYNDYDYFNNSHLMAEQKDYSISSIEQQETNKSIGCIRTQDSKELINNFEHYTNKNKANSRINIIIDEQKPPRRYSNNFHHHKKIIVEP